jgi:DNA-binding transcriptional MerR regulator
MATTAQSMSAKASAGPNGSKANGSRRKALTIGAVCKILEREFEDISISKIRYLEDQKLLAPRRTAGGYRLYSQADVERLREILRMQRDEFLPLKVIRQELASGQAGAKRRRTSAEARRAISLTSGGPTMNAEEAIERAGADEKILRELEEYGIVQPNGNGEHARYDETDVEILRAAAELGRYGVSGRNLKVFRTSASREAGLLEQLLGGSLRSRSPSRRDEAREHLEGLAATCTRLSHLLLVRDLRRLEG